MYTKIISLLATAGLVSAQSFCNGAQHSGTSVRETQNKVGSINGIGYELWADGGNNSATFYSDGSFSCSFSNSHDYLCRTGLSFDSTQTHDQIGHMKADFKLVKQNIQNVGYSYVGIYGWTRNPLVEYYIVDNWLSPGRPGDWVGNRKHGDFNIDGAMYTVYENTRYNAPSIDGNTTFKQFFSIRQQARDCGTIDITAHFNQWAKLGMQLGKMHEAKVLGEAGNGNGGVSGTADFPYAKVYIADGNGNAQTNTQTNTQNQGGFNQGGNQGFNQGGQGGWNQGGFNQGGQGGWNQGGFNQGGNQGFNQGGQGGWNQWGQMGGNQGFNQGGNQGFNQGGFNQGGQQQQQQAACSANILKQGYKCCNSGCQVVYTDADGDWGVENNQWCGCGNRNVIGIGQCSAKITSQGYRCCQSGCIIYYVDNDGQWGVENDQWCGCGSATNNNNNGNQQQQQQQQQKSNFNYNANLQYKDAPGSYTNSRGQQAGKVVRESYNGINGQNTLYVYLPYGYDDNKKYNIFYIMHGGGENEGTIFGNDVHLDYILDHMIQDKLIEPMIVVTPTFNKCEAGTFWKEFRQSTIQFVEKKYSTYANKDVSESSIKASRMHRAYGGFSMGGVSTWAVIAHCLDYVGYFMPLSGDHWEGNSGYDKARSIQNAVNQSGLQKNQYFIFVATGSEDIAYPNVTPQVEEMKKMQQFVYTSDFSKGNFYYLVAQGKTHWWGYVKHYVYDALPYFFHEGQ